MKRTCTLMLLATGMVCGGLPREALPADEPRPNILWFVVDDMSANFSCYGEKTIQTPHVDRLAREGTKFANAFVTSRRNGTASGGADLDKASGSRSTIDTMTSVGVAPANGLCPVIISYSTTPRLQTSVRASTENPRACSGDIYATVPSNTPGVVVSSIARVSA